MTKKNKFSQPQAKTLKQLEYIKAINKAPMVVAIGPAGTGKSYVAAAMAASFYHSGKVNKIILTRPTVPVGGKGVGFLPGTLEEKLAPWVAPFVSVLEEYLGKGVVECMVKNGNLEVIPFDVIRGHTFNNAFVVLDEAQNTVIADIKAFITRIGENSTLIIDGDETQSDLKDNQDSGLEYILDILGDDLNEELNSNVAVVEFDENDVVRSGLCKLWVKAFNGTR